VLILDAHEGEDNVHLGRDFIISAQTNCASNNFRKWIRGPYGDISMLPPPHKEIWKYPKTDKKKYFIGFKGHLSRGGKSQYSHIPEAWLIRRMLREKSEFLLVLRGDHLYSYRINEAICLGGIPVLVTDRWMPPFNQLVPFEDYGVIIDEKDWESLVDILRAIGTEKKRILRRNAAKMCELYAERFRNQIDGLLKILLEVDVRVAYADDEELKPW